MQYEIVTVFRSDYIKYVQLLKSHKKILIPEKTLKINQQRFAIQLEIG